MRQVVWVDDAVPVELPKSHKKVRIGDTMVVNGDKATVFYIEDLADGTRNVRLEYNEPPER